MMQRQQRSGSTRRPTGFTLIELMVAISILGILISLMLPAVQQARETARRIQCQSHLHQLGVALHNFASSRGAFPAGVDFAQSRQHAWSTHLLPMLEQTSLYQQYDWDRPWDDATRNASITSVRLPVYECPSTPEERMGGIDFAGNYGTSLTGLTAGFDVGEGWEAGALLAINTGSSRTRVQPARIGEFVDGTSQTLLVVECAGRTSPGGYWGNGTNCTPIEMAVNQGDDGESLFSFHPQGAQALFADGHVAFISESIDLLTLARAATRAGNEVTPSF